MWLFYTQGFHYFVWNLTHNHGVSRFLKLIQPLRKLLPPRDRLSAVQYAAVQTKDDRHKLLADKLQHVYFAMQANKWKTIFYHVRTRINCKGATWQKCRSFVFVCWYIFVQHLWQTYVAWYWLFAQFLKPWFSTYILLSARSRECLWSPKSCVLFLKHNFNSFQFFTCLQHC